MPQNCFATFHQCEIVGRTFVLPIRYDLFRNVGKASS